LGIELKLYLAMSIIGTAIQLLSGGFFGRFLDLSQEADGGLKKTHNTDRLTDTPWKKISASHIPDTQPDLFPAAIQHNFKSEKSRFRRKPSYTE
jgi:hypothetical protein